MGEDVQMRDYEGDEDEERVLEWEDGLPSVDDLTPLSQPLISPELASAFSITPEPCRTMIDVNRASQTTLSSLCQQNQAFLSSNLKQLPSFTEDRSRSRDSVVVEGDEPEQELENEKLGNSTKDGSSIRKLRRLENAEDVSSALQMENSNDDQSAQTLKRPRLVWTPQLHKRFVDVITHLGIKNAVPKTIMQLMNVEGLTRENVASHLQKYRQYLKRMQGLSNEGPSSSDPLFASTPVPQSLHESSQQGYMPVPMSYGVPLMSVPYLGLPHGQGHMGMLVGNTGSAAYHGFDPNHYNMFREPQRDWCGNNVSRHHVTPNDN